MTESMDNLNIRKFILKKRIDIIVEVIALKDTSLKLQTHIPEFYKELVSLLRDIHKYIITQELTEEMMNYSFKGVSYVEHIVNLLDKTYIELKLKTENSEENYKGLVEAIGMCKSKFTE
jgi:hypothetical protein